MPGIKFCFGHFYFTAYFINFKKNLNKPFLLFYFCRKNSSKAGSNMRYIIWLNLFFLGFCIESYATHIIGGEITYSCLGNNKYEITLVVYRDCFNGVPPFDDTVSIGVFNYKNELIDDIRIPYMHDDTIKQTLIGDCKVIPPNVCVHTSVYKDTIDLKPILGGYTLVYQRCCRNKTIVNIVKPDDTGASFVIQITEKALLECNSSAKFKYWPPIYICANEPIIFDHSAIDPDGDSIVYKLCTPTNGLKDDPQPQPPNAPPYDKVVWKDPPYNIDNLMGGVPLAIDSKTGLLTGIPNTIGQFVVGVCIEEYRDGKIISTTTRDFQYNVGLCGKTESAFFVPDVNCSGLNVSFINQSQNGNKFEWDFGDPTTTLDKSTIFNPNYTYPDTGTYTVKLIAKASEICTDTFFKTIKVYKNSLSPEYKLKLLSCTDSMVVAVTDASIDTVSSIVSWKYYLKIGGVLKDSSTLKNPVFVGDTLGIWEITLIVTNELGCEKVRKRNIVFPKMIQFKFPTDTLYKCPGQELILPGPVDTNYILTWAPGSYLSDSTKANPVCFTPQDIHYTLKVKDKLSICNVTRDLWVKVAPEFSINLPDSISTCDKDFKLTISTDAYLPKIYTSYQKDFSQIIDTTDEVMLNSISGQKLIYVKITDFYGCEKIDSVKITGNGIYHENPDDLVICPGDTANVVVKQGTGPTMNIQWLADPSLNANGFGAKIFPAQSGKHWYYYTLSNQAGCLVADSFAIFVVDTVPTVFFTYHQCAGTRIFVEANGKNAPYYHWLVDDGDSVQYFQSAPFSIDFADTGVYQIKAWVPGAVCLDTLLGQISVGKGSLDLSYQLDVPVCHDSLVVALKNTSEGYDPNIHKAYWYSNFGGLVEGDSLKITLHKVQPDLKILLIIDQMNGCVDTIPANIAGTFIPTIPDDSIKTCSGREIKLNYNAYAYLSFEWQPAALVSDPTIASPIIKSSQSEVLTASIKAQITDSVFCQSAFKVFLDVLPSAEYTVQYDSVICDSASIISVKTDIGNSILWFDTEKLDNVIAIGDSLKVKPDRHSTYYGTVTAPSGCVDTIMVNILNQLPQILPNPAILCAGDTAIVSVINLFAGDQLSCVFDPSGLVFVDSATGNYLVTADKSFELDVTCTNQYGCSVTKELPVDVFEYQPPLSITADPTILATGQSAQLNATYDPGYSYFWSPAGSLSNAAIHNPVATPEQSTSYTLLIINEDGCRNEASILVQVFNPVCEEPFSFIPNAFSPNGDGKNDRFYIRGEFITEIKLSVYNRWGVLVYYSEDKDEGWDGSYKGDQSSPDVYGYQVEFLCADGKRFFKKGNVSLFR